MLRMVDTVQGQTTFQFSSYKVYGGRSPFLILVYALRLEPFEVFLNGHAFGLVDQVVFGLPRVVSHFKSPVIKL